MPYFPALITPNDPIGSRGRVCELDGLWKTNSHILIEVFFQDMNTRHDGELFQDMNTRVLSEPILLLLLFPPT